MEKMHRQKISEVEKLSTTIAELEEAVLAGGATANAVRESQQHVNLLMVGDKVCKVDRRVLWKESILEFYRHKIRDRCVEQRVWNQS